MMPSEGHF